VVVNSDAEFYGVEVEGTARLTEHLDLFAALGWQDGKYKGVAPTVFGTTVGKEPQRLPEITAKIGASYYRPVGDDRAVRLTVDFNYLEDHFTNLQNSALGASGYVELWNAKLDYELADGKYTLSASCRNCANKEYVAQSFDFAGINFVQVYPGAPRDWLLSFKVKF